MASTSLGTLTLDLAVRLSEFTDGLSRAERETRDRTENMSASVRNFREQLAENLGGTAIGDVIGSLNDRLGALSGGGIAAGGALAGMAVGGAVVAAGALAVMAVETAKADVQLQVMAGTANTSLRNFQILTHAAEGLGVEQEALAAILADTQEKLGEFSATGGGGAADFFEALQNNTSMTDEQIRQLGKTLQGKDGVEAIQYLKDELDALGATSQEQRFIMESLAGDLGNLMPLFADGGKTLEEYGVQLTDAGVIKTAEAIEQSRILAAQTQAAQTQFEGMKTQLVAQMIPALGTLATYFTEGTTTASGFKNEVSAVGRVINGTAAMVVGLAAGLSIIITAFDTVGANMRMIGKTYMEFEKADGFFAKSRALSAGLVGMAGVTSVGMSSITDQYDRAVDTIERLMDGQQKKLTGLAGTYYNANNFLQSHTNGLAVNTVEAEANAKALEKQAAALKKVSTADSSKYIQYANQNATRNQKLDPKLVSALSFLQDEGIVFRVTSGGQGAKGSGAKRVGSTAHDGGMAADGDLYRNGRKLDWNNSKDLPLLKAIVEEAAARGINGIGAGNNYMGAGRFHFGIQNTAASWGKDGKSANVMPWLQSAHSAGMARKGAGTFYGKSIAEAQKEQEKANNEALRAQEELERRKLSITNQYATMREKIESEHTDRITAIEAAYAEGSEERTKYLARENERYAKEKGAAAQSIAEKYMTEEEQIHAKHRAALLAIDEAYIEDDALRQQYIDAQNAMYQEDLANFKFTAEAKAREQSKLYQSIANSMSANRLSAVDTGLDSMAQRTMSDSDYARWRLAQDHDASFNAINDQYDARQSEINAVDERGNYFLPELERFELLETAKQEHLDKMWAMEQDYALKQQTLDEQLAAQRVMIRDSAFSAMTSAAVMFFGENSKMHHAAFAMERTIAVQKALMNVEETYSNTFNSISAIPLIGPYIAGPMAAVAAGMQVARAATIGSMSVPSVAGIAHGGLDYVPKESTYLLDEGERVLSPRQNKDLAKFMANGQKTGNITINNNSSAAVSAHRNPNGEVTIEVVDKMIEQSFRRIGRANSLESKSVRRGTTARVNRT